MSRRKEKKEDPKDFAVDSDANGVAGRKGKKGGKERSGNRKGDEGDSSGSEDVPHSVAGGVAPSEVQNEEHVDHYQTLSELNDNLTEKRSATREAALKKLIDLLSRHYLMEDVSRLSETLTDSLKRSFKKGGTEERTLALRCMSLLFITIGESPNIFNDISPLLRQTANDSEAEDTVAPLALSILGLVTYFCSNEETATRDTIDFCGKMSSTALRAETFVLCSYPPITIVKAFYLEKLKRASQFFSNEHVDVRLAAAEQAAFLIESRREVPEEISGEIDDAGLIGQIVSDLNEISATSDRSQSKQERSRLRSGLRELIQSIENNQQPSETITINKAKFTYETWREILQIQYIRDMSSSGFSVHMQENEILRQIFDMDIVAPRPQMSGLEKRLYLSSNSTLSKARDLNRHKGRDRKSAVRSSAIAEDD